MVKKFSDIYGVISPSVCSGKDIPSGTIRGSNDLKEHFSSSSGKLTNPSPSNLNSINKDSSVLHNSCMEPVPSAPHRSCEFLNRKCTRKAARRHFSSRLNSFSNCEAMSDFLELH